jgi:hypothetical protein
MIDLPDEQTVSFVKRVKAWMEQWTIANNYDRWTVAPDNDKLALLDWRKKFTDSFRSAIPEMFPKDGNLDRHFQFVWYEEPLFLNSRVQGMGFSTCSIELVNIAAMEGE